MKNSNFYTILLCTILFCLGCSKPVIEGEVKDCLDKPIENVRVNIKNTRLQAITDKEGKYSIEYIPGTFTVLYSKPDYTSHEIRLSLTSKEKFPARKVTLCTLPKLYIKTAPEKADIKIIGIQSKYYEGLNLEPGTYSLEVSADGYTTKRQQVSLMAGANKKLYIQLDLVAPFPIKKSVNARFIDNSISGQIFVISGKVKNELSKQIKIRGTLITKNGKVAKVAIANCGNVISETELKSLDIGTIQTRLSSDVRGNKQNSNIPFMIVFSNLPVDLDYYEVEIIDFK